MSIAIIMRCLLCMTLMQCWLLIALGPTGIGFIVSGVATWHDRTELWAVLARTVGASLVSGLVLVLLV